VDDTITFLSETILRLQLLTGADFRSVLDEDRLEGFSFARIKLSSAIIECLTVAIKLVTSKTEGK
jgi:hypothetical protein